MGKRFFPLILICCLICSFLVVPAYASDLDSDQQQLVNVLEYTTPNASGSYYITSNTSGIASAVFDLPYGTIIRYVDMYISHVGDINSAMLIVNGSRTELTIEKIDSGTYYRVYGNYSGAYTESFTLEFDVGTSYSRVMFYGLHFSPQSLTLWGSPSVLDLEGETVSQEYGDSSALLSAEVGNPGEMAMPYLGSIHNSEWQKFDYMSFTMVVHATSINSITCTIGNYPVPFEVSYLDSSLNDLDGWIYENAYSLNKAFYDVTITVDLTGMNRTATDDLIICIAGTSDVVSMALYYSRGYNVAEIPEAEITWLQTIANHLSTLRNYVFGIRERFDTLLEKITGDQTAADDFNSALDDSLGDLQQSQDALDSVDTPDISVDVGDLDLSEDTASAGSVLSDFFTVFLSHSWLATIFTVVVTVSLLKYVLFGKG